MYGMFVILAAPFEAYIYYFNGLGVGRIDVSNYPWTHGIIYVIAILLFAETIFRLAHNWQFVKDNGFALLILASSILGFAGTVLWYLAAERVQLLDGNELLVSSWQAQNALVAISAILSVCSFAVIEFEFGKIDSIIPKVKKSRRDR